MSLPIPGVRPLLFPANYTPSPATAVHEDAAEASVASKAARDQRRQVLHALRREFPAADVVRFLAQPGHAVVSFLGGVSLFVDGQCFQASTLLEAMGAARAAGVSMSGVTTAPESGTTTRSASKPRTYAPKPCRCGVTFIPSGPRALFCEACRS